MGNHQLHNSNINVTFNTSASAIRSGGGSRERDNGGEDARKGGRELELMR